MKKFDITFRGEVLPKHDPEQVKAGFVELFEIRDQGMLEDIFSGETVVLRSNLDRKAAAEYFVKVNQLGGVIRLVTSSARHRDKDSGPPDMPGAGDSKSAISSTSHRRQKADGEAMISQAGLRDRNWAVSTARLSRQRQKNGTEPDLVAEMAPTQPAEDTAVKQQNQPDKAPATAAANTDNVSDKAFALTQAAPSAEAQGESRLTGSVAPGQDLCAARERALELERRIERERVLELKRVREEKERRDAEEKERLSSLARRIHEETRRELARLQARGVEIQKETETRLNLLEQQAVATGTTAEQEIARLKELTLDTRDKSQEEIKRLQQLELSANDSNEQDISRLTELEAQSSRKIEAVIAQFNTLEEELNARAAGEIATLEQTVDATRDQAAAEIARLEQQIVDTRRQAELAVEELLTQVEAAIAQTREETAKLKDQRDEAEHRAREEAQELKAQLDLSLLTNRERIAEINTMQNEVRRMADAELARLAELEQKADQRAENTIAGLRSAMAATKDWAVQEMEQLQARESEVLCNQAAQLARLKRQ